MVGKKKLEVGSWRRLLGILEADKLQLAASRAGKTFCQQPDVGHNGEDNKRFSGDFNSYLPEEAGAKHSGSIGEIM